MEYGLPLLLDLPIREFSLLSSCRWTTPKHHLNSQNSRSALVLGHCFFVPVGSVSSCSEYLADILYSVYSRILFTTIIQIYYAIEKSRSSVDLNFPSPSLHREFLIAESSTPLGVRYFVRVWCTVQLTRSPVPNSPICMLYCIVTYSYSAYIDGSYYECPIYSSWNRKYCPSSETPLSTSKWLIKPDVDHYFFSFLIGGFSPKLVYGPESSFIAYPL